MILISLIVDRLLLYAVWTKFLSVRYHWWSSPLPRSISTKPKLLNAKSGLWHATCTHLLAFIDNIC